MLMLLVPLNHLCDWIQTVGSDCSHGVLCRLSLNWSSRIKAHSWHVHLFPLLFRFKTAILLWGLRYPSFVNNVNFLYRLISAYLLLQVNCDKIMHARWDFDVTSARTQRMSALDNHQNWSTSALFCHNSRA